MANHLYCCQARAPRDWFPTRIIEVGAESSSVPRLVSRCPAILGKPYVALSHRWSSQMQFTLTNNHLNEFHKCLPLEVPSTFQDAFLVTRLLGYNYLWIDALCIIQDSVEDWREESSMMGQIYQNSAVTISALAGTDDQGGFIRSRDPLDFQPCRLTGRLCTSHP